MPTLVKPKKGEDVRLLHRDVRKLVEGINALTNMTAIWNGRAKGHGRLSVRGGGSEIYIKVEDFTKGGGGRHTPPITLTSNANPADFGVTIIWSAALPSNAQGTVRFLVDGVGIGVITLVNGVAFSPGKSDLESGQHIIHAHYSGDANYTQADTDLIQTVNELDAPDVQPFGFPNPVNEGDDLILATYVLPNSPIPPAPPITGSVRFTIDSEHISQEVPLIDLGGNTWGAQSDAIGFLTHGTYDVTARYLGDSHYGQAFASYVQVVKALVDVTMWIDPNPVHTNNNTTLHAIVTGGYGVATGTIQFHNENGNVGGPVALSGGQAQLLISAGTVARTFTFTARYSGDGNYASSESDPNILYISDFPPFLYIYLPGSSNFSFGNYNVCHLFDHHPFNDPPGGYTGNIRIRCSPHYPFCAFYYNPQPPPTGWANYYAGVFNCALSDGVTWSYILPFNGYVDVPMVDGACLLNVASISPVPDLGAGYFAPCSQGGIYAEFQAFNPAGGNYIPIRPVPGSGEGTGWYQHFCHPE